MNPTTTEGTLSDAALATFARALALMIATEFPEAPTAEIRFEAPRRPEFGDYATNASFGLARFAKRSPQQLAQQLVERLQATQPHLTQSFANIEALAGFINLRLAPQVRHAQLAQILHAGASYGHLPATGERISLEFGSANPTGPLVVVQGRALSIGDALARAMRFCGIDVFVEWIINDAGSQVETLGRSLYARYRQSFDPTFPFPEDGYPAAYLLSLAQTLRERDGERWIAAEESAWLPYFIRFGRDELVAQQRATVTRFGVRYDLWQSEREMHDDGRVQAGIQRLVELGLTYEADGATYFRATQFGDDKDRVLVRSDGRPTYLSSDIAYHYEKLQRADRVIDILGPDHHGYIGRLTGLASALGYPGKLAVMIAQQITLLRGGEQVGMSKRAGEIITLDEILDEVGVDAARFYFAMLSPEQPLKFDLKLALEESAENPVFYVQYAHARIASLLKNANASEHYATADERDLAPLTHPSELALIGRLADFPRTVRSAVEHLAPHRLAHYAREVAGDFHAFYADCKILVEDPQVRRARLALAFATKTILAQGLDLLGVSAPEAM